MRGVDCDGGEAAVQYFREVAYSLENVRFALYRVVVYVEPEDRSVSELGRVLQRVVG